MFAKNMGTMDRVIRIIVGLALISGVWLMPDASWRWLFWVGLIPLVTGLMGSCLLYSLLGVSTCGSRART